MDTVDHEHKPMQIVQVAQGAVNCNVAWSIVCQRDQGKWAILPNKKPGSDTTPGSGEKVRPLVILAYGAYMPTLAQYQRDEKPVARDLGINIQCVGTSVVPLAALLINIG
jgi:hypothetical protein